MTRTQQAGTAVAIAAGVAAAVILGTSPDPAPETDEHGDPIAYTSYAAWVIGPCGDMTTPGLAHLPPQARAQARCRPGRQAQECAAIRVPEGESPRAITDWRIVGEPVVLASHPCAGDSCLIDPAECNAGQVCIVGSVEKEVSPEQWAGYEGICCGASCRCADGDCVTGPADVESGSGVHWEGFCAQRPGHPRCLTGEP